MGNLPPAVNSMRLLLVEQRIFSKARQSPLARSLLLQQGFPGVGNWMADEILWQAGFASADAPGA